MIPAEEALRIILESTHRLGSENVFLGQALGRTAARTLLAGQDLPPFDNSSMDGFAIRAEDTSTATVDAPVRLAVRGESSAGHAFGGRLKPFQAVRIMTGGKMPRGADAVVPLEQVRQGQGDDVVCVSPLVTGSYIRKSGEDLGKNEAAIHAGELIGPGQVGLCAALGRTRIAVAKKPLVHILATGSELVPIHRRPGDGQIRNSTSHSLESLVIANGAAPKLLGIVKDRGALIRKRIARGLAGDVLLITGGVSVGKYDLVKGALADLGVNVKFWKVNIKPGRPLLFGTRRRTLVFGLPGNPVSTAVTFLQFVRPALLKMIGRSELFPLRLPAVIDQEYKKNDGKRHFVRAVVRPWGSHLHVRLTGTQSSGAMSSMAKANCIMIVPEEIMTLNPGDPVEVELL